MNLVNDFVNGGACGGVNPLRGLVNSAEKSEHSMWQREFLQPGTQEDMFNDAHLRGMHPRNMRQPGGDSFLFPSQQNPEFAEFDNVWDNLPEEYDDFERPEISPAVSSTLHNFLHSSIHHQPMQGGILLPHEASFSIEDKLKIRDRSAALARHFCTDEFSANQMESRLGDLFNSLHIDPNEAAVSFRSELNLGSSWMGEYNNFQEEAHPPAMFERMERVWDREILPAPEVREWVSDFNQNQDRYDVTVDDKYKEMFNKVYSEIEQETGDDWAQQYTQQNASERQEEEEWFSQFLPGGEKFVSSTGDDWAREFAAQTQPTTARPWVDEYVSNETPEEWIDQFSQLPTDTSDPQTIADLTNKISQIPDEKLQNSNFMKFIKQINSGEVDLHQLQQDANNVS